MRRLLLAGLMLMGAGCSRPEQGQGPEQGRVPGAAVPTFVAINGGMMQVRVGLYDSRLNPNPGRTVELKWDPARQRYEGEGNGLTYRVVKEGDDWKVRAVLPGGDFALAWCILSPAGSAPLRFGGCVPRGLRAHYGIDDDDPDKTIEIQLVNL